MTVRSIRSFLEAWPIIWNLIVKLNLRGEGFMVLFLREDINAMWLACVLDFSQNKRLCLALNSSTVSLALTLEFSLCWDREHFD